MNNKTPSEIDVAVAHRFKKARKEQGLTQTDLAVQMGMSFQQVQKYETGKNRISAGHLYEIAIALNKPVSWFYNLADWELPDQPDPLYTECCELLLTLKVKGDRKLELARGFLKMAVKD